MADLQVPPAVGTSGQRLDTIVINAGSTIFRQTIVVGDPVTSGNLATVGSDGSIRTVTASSGLVQVLTTGTLLVVSASSGLVQTLTTGPYLTVSASSGVVQVLTTGTYIIVSASSGIVQVQTTGPFLVLTSGPLATLPSSTRTYTVFQFNASSSNSLVNLTTANVTFYGWNAGNQTTSATAALKCYDSTTATVGSTTNLKLTIPLPGGSAGAGSNMLLAQGVIFTSGITVVITGNYASTSTGTTHSAGDVVSAFYYV